ncbi:MAG: DegT/DnrJ/EryC1/StrS family aminotransferase [Taibaiella sp.]|nr:DegT/DnrJ/EryC1/StrS family aminotransferase [Taibaiella sp.]
MKNRSSAQNEFPLMEKGENNVVLFHPHIPKNGINEVTNTLNSRWIGQGPKVDMFEQKFSSKFANGNPSIAVGSGTDALHLAYLLAELKEGDEVIVPVFTCTATNIPFLYMGVKIIFADIDAETMNISVAHVKELINEKTKAIVCVHYGGLPCDMDELKAIADEYNIPVIEDAAHALGAKYKGKSIGEISDFTMYSFQAIKHITTGDGGLLTFKNKNLLEKSKRLRWFGIDRSAKQGGIWENDIYEVGYKYQMTDIGASLGLTALEEFDEILSHRQNILKVYNENLVGFNDVKLIGTNCTDREHAAWICTIYVENRLALQSKLRDYNIESAQVHYRNDRYSIFGKRRHNLPNMDMIEDNYLVLPLHTRMSGEDAKRVCDVIKTGW